MNQYLDDPHSWPDQAELLSQVMLDGRQDMSK
jgi:hypothetical protein